jgi:uncharacterized protein
MQIWLNTLPTDLHLFASSDCDNDDGVGDCNRSGNYSLIRNYLSTVNKIQDSNIYTLSLQQATPLHMQQCASERWLVCNPTGSGHIAVLDTSAKFLFEQFHKTCTLAEILPLANSETSEHIADMVGLFYMARLLQTYPRAPTIYERQETEIVTAWLHVTNACNLRCQYCYLDKTTEHMNEDTAFRAVDAVIRSALKHHCKYVRLKYAGGEASLHMARVITIHDYALHLAQQHDLTLGASILSNGVVLSQRTIGNLKARNIGVTISLDGLGYYHDSQRPFHHGQPSFKYVDRTINLLLANELIPHITVTVSQRNLAGLPDLFMYLLEHRLPFTLNYYRDNEYATDRNSLQFSEEAMIDAMHSAFDIIERYLPERSLLGSLIDKANLRYAHQHTCGVGHNYLVIDQHGGIAKCQANIKQTVTTIDTDDPLQLIRDDLKGIQNLPVEEKEGCRSCNWRYWCTGGCPLLTHKMTGRYDIKSPNCHIYQSLFPDVVRLEALRLLKYTQPFTFLT